MQRVQQLLLLLSLAVLGGGCSTSYWADRGRDAADVFTVCSGIGAGAKARVGSIHVGALLDLPMFGLRGGGAWFNGLTLGGRGFGGEITASDVQFPLYADNVEMFDVREGGDYLDYRHKNFLARGVPIWEGVLPAFPGAVPFILLPERNRATYYFQLEAVVGLVPSLRLGFNPLELTDFLLGWTTLDILGDDIGT